MCELSLDILMVYECHINPVVEMLYQKRHKTTSSSDPICKQCHKHSMNCCKKMSRDYARLHKTTMNYIYLVHLDRYKLVNEN